MSWRVFDALLARAAAREFRRRLTIAFLAGFSAGLIVGWVIG